MITKLNVNKLLKFSTTFINLQSHSYEKIEHIFWISK